eukprot:TRINITY_DN3784_c2_g2_i3.p2 TRINITY_DN3784_c2_g2~~TRINITY_DN3784_c2_g2_i3.p2  ORF type:complete len:234 (-),score=-17.83 TRINITY_DN3784_c2_g2_i3:225-926(-)
MYILTSVLFSFFFISLIYVQLCICPLVEQYVMQCDYDAIIRTSFLNVYLSYFCKQTIIGCEFSCQKQLQQAFQVLSLGLQIFSYQQSYLCKQYFKIKQIMDIIDVNMDFFVILILLNNNQTILILLKQLLYHILLYIVYLRICIQVYVHPCTFCVRFLFRIRIYMHICIYDMHVYKHYACMATKKDMHIKAFLTPSIVQSFFFPFVKNRQMNEQIDIVQTDRQIDIQAWFIFN